MCIWRSHLTAFCFQTSERYDLRDENIYCRPVGWKLLLRRAISRLENDLKLQQYLMAQVHRRDYLSGTQVRAHRHVCSTSISVPRRQFTTYALWRNVFYPRDAMLERVFAIATCLSVRLSVRLSVCHTPVLCLAERKQDCEMYTVW